MTMRSTEQEASQDVRDETLMRRFLVDDLDESARERIEARLVEDEEYCESLRALELEMLRDYARGDLAEPWRSLWEASIPAFPGRRAELEELRRLMLSAGTSLPHISRVRPSTVHAARTVRRVSPLMAIAASAVFIAGGFLIWQVVATPTDRVQEAAVEQRATNVVRLPLLASDFRAVPEPGARPAPAEAFRIPEGTDAVALTFTVRGDGLTQVRTVLRRRGGEPIDVPSAPVVQFSARDEARVEWTVPVAQIPPADYVVEVSGDAAAGRDLRFSSWSFSIVR
jgi:hypothetical protein